ncbi:MAG: hypothetical protein ACOX2I_04185 [Candidatus Ozemobacteraceae bacterium]
MSPLKTVLAFNISSVADSDDQLVTTWGLSLNADNITVANSDSANAAVISQTVPWYASAVTIAGADASGSAVIGHNVYGFSVTLSNISTLASATLESGDCAFKLDTAAKKLYVAQTAAQLYEVGASGVGASIKVTNTGLTDTSHQIIKISPTNAGGTVAGEFDPAVETIEFTVAPGKDPAWTNLDNTGLTATLTPPRDWIEAYDGTSVTDGTTKTAAFWENTAGYSTGVWNFEDDSYPTLKNIP